MDISLNVHEAAGDATLSIYESNPLESFAGDRNKEQLTALLANVLLKACRALDLNVYDLAGLISESTHQQLEQDSKISMAAETWPLFVTSLPNDDDDVIVYCGDDDCSLQAENSEILRLQGELDEEGNVLGFVMTLKRLREELMGHIILVNERKTDETQS
jgi:hypothetical protein